MLLLREWYMHPNGQIPAYEWDFSRRQPAGARLGLLARLQDRRRRAASATALFLERAFQKLLLNFTWWVNRKDTEGNNLFSGGFLGLDNIGVFDRSKPLPGGGHARAGRRHRVDGLLLRAPCSRWRSSWRASDPAYEDIASKFFEHFVAIADAMNTPRRHRPLGRGGRLLLRPAPRSTASSIPLRVRSMVGLIPLFAVEVARGGDRSTACPASQADALVPRATARTWRSTSPTWSRPSGRHDHRLPARHPVARAPASACCATCSTRTSSSRRTASARCRASTATTRSCCAVDGEDYRVDYEPGESRHRPVRRQLELARPDLVPDQLPAHRGARALPPLLRRHVQGRVPDRLGRHDEPRRRSPASSPRAWPRSSCPTRRAAARATAAIRASPTTRTGRTSSSSTSTSTATPAAASAPATRPAGPRWRR